MTSASAKAGEMEIRRETLADPALTDYEADLKAHDGRR